MKYSIIFLVDEESDEFSGFFGLVHGLFEREDEDFEVLVVANGTSDFVAKSMNSRKNHLERAKLIAFPAKVPQAVCLNAALCECSGALILTLSPYQELTSPSYEKIIHAMTDGVDLVAPYRKQRKDAFLNRMHSKILNRAVRWVLGVGLHDIGCNVRFFRREVLESLELYGNVYRYFPALAAQKGFKLKEVECDQVEKVRKAKYYRMRLYLDRSIEILNLFFSTRFSRKPLRFFNLVGGSLMLLGLAALVYVGIQKVVYDVPVGARPLLMIGMIGLVGGTQIASFGLLGEIISFVHGFHRLETTESHEITIPTRERKADKPTCRLSFPVWGDRQKTIYPQIMRSIGIRNASRGTGCGFAVARGGAQGAREIKLWEWGAEVIAWMGVPRYRGRRFGKSGCPCTESRLHATGRREAPLRRLAKGARPDQKRWRVI
jgi:hypothetical protein